MNLKSITRWLALILFALTFFYQYIRINKNLSHIVKFKSMSESIADPTAYGHYSIKFSDEILEGTMHSKSVLYFQAGLLVLLGLLQLKIVNRREK
jgi:hypothetical protein